MDIRRRKLQETVEILKTRSFVFSNPQQLLCDTLNPGGCDGQDTWYVWWKG